MAEQPTTRLLTTPKPPVTRYNRLVLYGVGTALALFVCTYLLVVRDRGSTATSTRPVRLVSSPQPLVPEPPKKPEPAPPPPPPEPAVYIPPLQHDSPAFPRKEDPLVKLRADERIKAYRSPVLVKFDGAQPVPAHQEAAAPNPQTLEIPPAGQQPFGGQQPFAGPPPRGWQGGSPPGGLPQAGIPTWANRDSTGRNADFWGLSGFARTPQVATAQLLPPRSPFQINAGMQIPVVLGQDLSSDAEGTFVAIVSQDVYDAVSGRYLLVPAGSRIFGITDVDAPNNLQPRLLLAAKTLYLPNGYSLALSGAPGVNALGMTGVSDVVNRHFFQRYGAAAFLSLVTAGIRMATYSGHGGVYYAAPGDAATYGSGQVLGQATGEDLRRSMNIRPTVQIRAGYPFNVTVVQDLVFPAPYALAPAQMASTASMGEWR